ncbi:hypothetical protein [Algoriphagus sp. NF]|nr:hypothetical protein [Algoriphagus sp. NF]
MAEFICFGYVPFGYYVKNVRTWSLCPDGYQMEIEKTGAEAIRTSGTP